MRLVPAIDIRDGRCVRLRQGRFDQETRYDVEPAELAARFRAAGAQWLHVVDLDGAAKGKPVNLCCIKAIRSSNACVQLGGGLRDRESLSRALEVVDRVVIGSLALSNPDQVANWIAEFGPERFTLGFDVRINASGTAFVATHGWTRTSTSTLDDALELYAKTGLQRILCTDIDRDGAMAGPNIALYRQCSARWPNFSFQASGGIRSATDLQSLAEAGIQEAISGKALLEGHLTEAELSHLLAKYSTDIPSKTGTPSSGRLQ